MAYLKFHKEALVNLEYSLKREFLSSNRSGGYTYTTIAGCNTRKYHGLLVVPLEQFGGEKHLLLSSLDETLIQHDKEFHLGIHQYDEIYDPRGHKYIVDFEIDKCVAVTYRVGGMLLRKVIMLSYLKEQLLIQYTLLDAHSPTIMRLRPFLAFRNIHNLSRANSNINFHFREVENGICTRLYEGFPSLYMQLGKKAGFNLNPDWYYNIEYREEHRRVLESKEDLFVPGYFEFPMAKGETIIFSASLKQEDPAGLENELVKQMSYRKHRDSFENTLSVTARQFLNYRGDELEVYAGFPWLDKNIRDTLIAAPGLTLFAGGDKEAFVHILDTILKKEEYRLLTDNEQPDIAFWFFRAVQQLGEAMGDKKAAWVKYRKILLQILSSFRDGSRKNVVLHDNGLLWAEEPGVALSWMDAYVNTMPVTERAGYQVELNALWYNAICYAVDMETGPSKGPFRREWGEIADRCAKSFLKAFWLEKEGMLADYVGHEGQNKFVRPNQLITCALDYSPLDDEAIAAVLKTIGKELLTPRGIRTLSPVNQFYKPEYDGDQYSRDMAYHQGTSRVWLLGYYIEASLKLYGESFVRKATELVDTFEEDMTVHCIGSISELYDGDPPFQPHGCPSYATSVAELLRSLYLIGKYGTNK
jgi:predicted glycogen debranching enzyme